MPPTCMILKKYVGSYKFDTYPIDAAARNVLVAVSPRSNFGYQGPNIGKTAREFRIKRSEYMA